MKEKNKIVVFGGSFNPPINSHFSIAEQVLNQFEDIDKIIFVPVSCNYEKTGLITDEHRYNMIKLVADKNENFIVSDIDLNREKSLTTIEVVENIKRIYKNKKIFILMGTDNISDLHNWNNATELLSNYGVIVMERKNDKLEEIIQNDKLLSKYEKNIFKLEDTIRSNYSSTFIRTQIKNKKSIRYLVPEEIREYIEKNKLYE